MSRQADNSGNEIVVVEGTYKHDTEKATLLVVANKEWWFPKSQLQKPSVCMDNIAEEWTIFIPRWLAKSKNGLSYDEYDENDWPLHTCDKETGEIPEPEPEGEQGTLNFDDFDDDIPF